MCWESNSNQKNGSASFPYPKAALPLTRMVGRYWSNAQDLGNIFPGSKRPALWDSSGDSWVLPPWGVQFPDGFNFSFAHLGEGRWKINRVLWRMLLCCTLCFIHSHKLLSSGPRHKGIWIFGLTGKGDKTGCCPGMNLKVRILLITQSEEESLTYPFIVFFVCVCGGGGG